MHIDDIVRYCRTVHNNIVGFTETQISPLDFYLRNNRNIEFCQKLKYFNDNEMSFKILLTDVETKLLS